MELITFDTYLSICIKKKMTARKEQSRSGKKSKCLNDYQL